MGFNQAPFGSAPQNQTGTGPQYGYIQAPFNGFNQSMNQSGGNFNGYDRFGNPIIGNFADHGRGNQNGPTPQNQAFEDLFLTTHNVNISTAPPTVEAPVNSEVASLKAQLSWCKTSSVHATGVFTP